MSLRVLAMHMTMLWRSFSPPNWEKSCLTKAARTNRMPLLPLWFPELVVFASQPTLLAIFSVAGFHTTQGKMPSRQFATTLGTVGV